MVDPFSLIYDRIVETLRRYASGRFQIIDWASTQLPQPDIAAASDLPEWQVRPTGMSPKLGGRSCASEVIASYQITVNTGDKSLVQALFPQEWELVKLAYFLKYDAFTGLKINEREFVEDVTLTGSTSGLVDPNTNRNIQGWAAVWNLSVYMSFSQQDLSL